MGKAINSTVLDQALNYIKNNATRMCVCSAEPTTYTQAITTFELADVTMASGDYTVQAGAVSGRRVTTAAKVAVPVDNSGTATHVALVDVTGTALLLVTTCTSQMLTAGNTVTIPAFNDEIAAPV